MKKDELELLIAAPIFATYVGREFATMAYHDGENDRDAENELKLARLLIERQEIERANVLPRYGARDR